MQILLLRWVLLSLCAGGRSGCRLRTFWEGLHCVRFFFPCFTFWGASWYWGVWWEEGDRVRGRRVCVCILTRGNLWVWISTYTHQTEHAASTSTGTRHMIVSSYILLDLRVVWLTYFKWRSIEQLRNYNTVKEQLRIDRLRTPFLTG